ncbi:zinc finger protein 595 [Nasonia vitripennis]|uniref:C2H2-type domain-containing protein n=1 Tax=Nasonia vitripennis TaxID=7425 RepID=A0A7M7HG14_NASVI|nr:zinc finger protein 595 [Nasonia vitripennis]XP_008215572.1 zinc finger protein 595 [Nasonia vitripennis]XP_008215581.1 zinc finger protein 595 [Nasonia vitripennis]XP_008215598.1 zinc finger protein 595 [Nasonia vitripennis]XP_031782391.1 zinc finger protein 595 [Nasonia vitripennis]
MMETNENEHYVAYSLDNVNEGLQDNISHEEICEPVDECVLQEGLTEVTVCDENSDITDAQVAVDILTENSQVDAEHGAVVYPIYIKKKVSQQFTTGDESMAVEALRQLGGMYPCFEDKKVTCTNCSNTFKQADSDKHQATCTSDKQICKTCGERFERKIDLNNHMVCHQVDRPHACRTCGNLFRSKANLQAHIAEVHQIERPHKCSVCGADFQRPSSLSNHMKIHSYVAGRALMQGNNTTRSIENFKTRSNPQDSSVLTTQVEAGQNFEIPQVQWAVQTYNFTNDDQGNIEGIVNQSDQVDTLQEFTVLPNGEVAQFEYTTQNAVGNQIAQEYSLTLNTFNSSDTILKLEATGYTNENKSAYVDVNMQENRGHTCSQCGVSFARASSLSLHEKTHTKSDLGSPVECEYCDKQFQDSTFLATHQASCAKKLMQNSTDKNLSNAKWGKHACSECGKKFTTKQKMFRHQWIHRKKTHSCEICGSQFEKQSELDEHRLSEHPGDSPFTCNECGKSFVSRQGLWEHGRTHAGSPAYFQCDTCSKTFSSRQGYLIHHRTHTGERPYGCKFCWKAFRDGGTLRKHERIHTGERPHVCPLCARAFNQKVVLREHVRWVHAAGKNETDITEPPFPCPLCETLTQDRDELCAHIVKHSDQLIAEAKAKSNNVTGKTKPQKKKVKALACKTKKTNSKASGGRIISVTEQAEALLSITEQTDAAEETPSAYVVVKNEYDGEVCIKAYTQSNDMIQNECETESINVIAIAKSSNNKNEEHSMHLIPLTTQGETIHLISNNNQNNTLHFISKQNKNSPVLTIPNPQNNEHFSNQLTQITDSETSMDVDKKDTEELHAVTMLIDPVDTNNELKFEEVINEEESEDESEEMICGICGSDFQDKNVLMEHVKIHI